MSRYFTQDHEWIDVDGDVGTVGITDYAQSQLGDIVFVEVPDAGRALTKGADAAVVATSSSMAWSAPPGTGTSVPTTNRNAAGSGATSNATRSSRAARAATTSSVSGPSSSTQG